MRKVLIFFFVCVGVEEGIHVYAPIPNSVCCLWLLDTGVWNFRRTYLSAAYGPSVFSTGWASCCPFARV